MKFWKIGILTVLVFVSVFVIIVHSSCEQNVCNNVTCYNGGACSSVTGICTCPIGYTGEQCQNLSTAVFVGTYIGVMECDNIGQPDPGGQTTDTVIITADPVSLNWVYVEDKGLSSTPLHGYISITPATYSVIVLADSAAYYLRSYSISLQGSVDLTINTFTHIQSAPQDTVQDTVQDNCYFKGSKQ